MGGVSETGNNEVRTIVLVGKTGNGKSATANSILGTKAFESGLSSAGVTDTCQVHTGVSQSGQPINVIDTPGLFDSSVGGTELITIEIAKCTHLAHKGINAIVLVLSLRSRFSQKEESANRSLKALFGPKIMDYMIVVFTGGDDLEDATIEQYLSRNDTPLPLKEITEECNNRVVAFNNRSRNEQE